MEAKGLTPILNVSDIAVTVAWFEKWGWKKLWDWGTPPTFGAVGSGKETCIFLCQGAREAAAAAPTPPRFSRRETKRATRRLDVGLGGRRGRDAQALPRRRLEVTFPPTDMPWNVREMHLRHPDGHVFRVGRGFEPKK